MEGKSGEKGFLEKVFHLSELGTNVRTEVIAGLTTFFTMAYIIFVNPQILGVTGMDMQGVFVATILAAAIGTLMMAFVANVPYALAPGMGLNAFFTYTVVIMMGFSWQTALAIVLICGIINTIITFTGLRKAIIKAMPKILQAAIAGGIGMFIAYIGFKNMGLFQFTADAPFRGTVSLDGTLEGLITVIGASGTVPAMVSFTSPSLLLGIFGLILMIVLLVRKVKGAILLGILGTTLVGIIIDLIGVLPEGVALTGISGLALTPASWGESIASIQNVAFHIDFAGLWTDPATGQFSWALVALALTAIVGFCLTDIFDCIGTLIGTGKKSGIFDENDMKKFEEGKAMASRLDKALTADLTATTLGSFLGTSNTTVYVESSSGIAEGGRSGLTSVFVAIFFLFCLILTPVIGVIPAAATAPALVVVGAMMMSTFVEIDWKKLEIAIPCFLAAVMMPLAYSITAGIGFGFISYVIVKAITGKIKEVHPVAWVVVGLFLINYIMQAVFVG
jgi:AGZA family xanthine/uracil permease-like MFS transporter